MSQYKQDQLQVQAIVQKPIKYMENVWGQDIRHDKNKRDFETEMSFWPKFGRDRLVTGSLPYTTSPRLRKNPFDRMMPTDTRISKVCWNEALNQAGPHYLRYWPIFDHVPFAPSSGDVTKDPRYGMDTRRFTQPYVTTSNGLTVKGTLMYGGLAPLSQPLL